MSEENETVDRITVKSVIDDLSTVPEALQDLYEHDEKEDKFVLSKSVFEDHPAWRKLKGTLNSLDRKKAEAEREAKKISSRYEKLPADLSLEDIEEERLEKALAFMRGEGELESNHKIDLDTIKANARRPLERDLKEAQAKAEEFHRLLIQTVRDRDLTDAIAAGKIYSPYQMAVRAMFRDRVKVEEGEDGMKTTIDGEYGPQDIKSYMKEWVQTEEGQNFTQAPNNTGGGARSGSGSGKVKNPWSKEHWSPDEQGNIYRQDPERARRMAAEHGKRVL